MLLDACLRWGQNPARCYFPPSSATFTLCIYFHFKTHFYSRLVEWTINPQALAKNLSLTAGGTFVSVFGTWLLSGSPISISTLQYEIQQKKIIFELGLAGSFQNRVLDMFSGLPSLLTTTHSHEWQNPEERCSLLVMVVNVIRFMYVLSFFLIHLFLRVRNL